MRLYRDYVCSQLEFNKVFVLLMGGIKKTEHTRNTQVVIHPRITVDMHAILIIVVVEYNVTKDL